MNKPNYPENSPLISVFVTVTHRDYVLKCLPSFLDKCTYPNYELLICHEGHEGTLEFLENIEAPRKQIWKGPRSLATKYRELRERSSGSHYYSIQDDWLYKCDAGPMMRDATMVLKENPDVCMVRMTSHGPVFVDMMHHLIRLRPTSIGPIAWGFGLADMQTIIHKRLFEKCPDIWPDGMDFYEMDGAWQTSIRRHKWDSASMLWHWGCCYHVGTVGDRGWQTRENFLNEREGKILLKYGLFGRRPRRALYSTWLCEELKCEFLYPHFLAGRGMLVPDSVPYEAQEIKGVVGAATRVA